MSWRAVTLFGYSAVVVAGLTLEVVAHRTGSIVTFDGLVRSLLRTRSGRIALFAAWAWLGVHFLG